jgi:hypothetical protein
MSPKLPQLPDARCEYVLGDRPDLTAKQIKERSKAEAPRNLKLSRVISNTEQVKQGSYNQRCSVKSLNHVRCCPFKARKNMEK